MFGNNKKYLEKTDFDLQIKKVYESISLISDSINNLGNTIESLANELSAVKLKTEENAFNIDDLEKPEPIDHAPYIKTMKNLSAKVENAEDSNKKIIEIVQTLNGSLNKLNEKFQSDKDKSKEQSDKLETTINRVNEKLDTSVEILLDRIAEKVSDEVDLPKIMLEDKCPFKRNHGYCEIWAKRKIKSDALEFCSPCLQSLELKEKGMG